MFMYPRAFQSALTASLASVTSLFVSLAAAPVLVTALVLLEPSWNMPSAICRRASTADCERRGDTMREAAGALVGFSASMGATSPLDPLPLHLRLLEDRVHSPCRCGRPRQQPAPRWLRTRRTRCIPAPCTRWRRHRRSSPRHQPRRRARPCSPTRCQGSVKRAGRPRRTINGVKTASSCN